MPQRSRGRLDCLKAWSASRWRAIRRQHERTPATDVRDMRANMDRASRAPGRTLPLLPKAGMSVERCRCCGESFELSDRNRQWFADQQLDAPTNCRDCRRERHRSA